MIRHSLALIVCKCVGIYYRGPAGTTVGCAGTGFLIPRAEFDLTHLMILPYSLFFSEPPKFRRSCCFYPLFDFVRDFLPAWLTRLKTRILSVLIWLHFSFRCIIDFLLAHEANKWDSIR